LPTGISKLCGAQESLSSHSGLLLAIEVARPPAMVTEGQQDFAEAAPQQTCRSATGKRPQQQAVETPHITDPNRRQTAVH